MRQTDSDSKTDKGTKKGRARESEREKDGERKEFFSLWYKEQKWLRINVVYRNGISKQTFLVWLCCSRKVDLHYIMYSVNKVTLLRYFDGYKVSKKEMSVREWVKDNQITICQYNWQNCRKYPCVSLKNVRYVLSKQNMQRKLPNSPFILLWTENWIFSGVNTFPSNVWR